MNKGFGTSRRRYLVEMVCQQDINDSNSSINKQGEDDLLEDNEKDCFSSNELLTDNVFLQPVQPSRDEFDDNDADSTYQAEKLSSDTASGILMQQETEPPEETGLEINQEIHEEKKRQNSGLPYTRRYGQTFVKKIMRTAVEKAMSSRAHLGSPNKRETATPTIKLPPDDVNFAIEHIDSFPNAPTHWCRKDTTKIYLESILN
ncbi:hypothetical protein ILUMI_15296 [Ignelater luminosus]|uniref:Uncharacterized protein n=1 Tax=Ignelater luminosus TaxID=2038154 RepID=A0A8K0G6Z8_IGNLU|nr:hypothetical protein ILUMI_15296 [Ignelater luminosus]